MSVPEPRPFPRPVSVEGGAPLQPAVERATYDDEDFAPVPLTWKTNLALFLATTVTMFLAGALYVSDLPKDTGFVDTVLFALKHLPSGWPLAVPLLAILLTHEFGHFVAARLHGVDASLPYFIPLPVFSPFGTMGAVISMRGRIRSRDALLDIGASGPLAGMAVAIPVLVIGLMQSKLIPIKAGSVLEGQCLLYSALKWLVLGPIPAGYDVDLSATAFAGWGGLFLTMLNLIAVGQLDGGHIAYALFGPRQNRYSRALHYGLLAMFAFNLARFAGPVVLARNWGDLGRAIGNSTFWLVWFVLLRILMAIGGRDHPPTEPGALSPGRRWIAVLSLILFALIFMPAPMTQR